jgi:hypothetical protein
MVKVCKNKKYHGIPCQINTICQKSVAAELFIWMKLGITTGWHGISKSTNILSYNSVVLRTENTEVCVMLAVSTSVVEALNGIEHCSSKTNRDIWMELIPYWIHIRGYQTIYKIFDNSH